MNKKLQGLLIWFIATLFVVYGFFLNTAAAVFAETIKTTLHLSDMGAIFAVGSFVLGFALMQIPAGYLLDRFSIRIVTSCGLFLLALGNLTLSFTSNLSLFVLSNFVQGIGASFSFIAAGKLIGEWFAPKIFPVLFGLTQSMACLLTSLIHYYLIKALQITTWQVIYQRLSLFGFILLVFMVIFVKSPSHIKKIKTLSFGKSLAALCKNKQVWLFSITGATSFGVLAAYASFWYMTVEQYFSADKEDALIISGLIFAGIGVGTPFLAWLSNKVKSRKLVIDTSVALGAIFLLLSLYLPHLHINAYISIKLISFFLGFFLSGSSLYYTNVSEVSSNNTRAVSLGLINASIFAFNTALLFIPQLFITKQYSSYFTYLWVLPVCVLVSIFLSCFTKETFSKSGVGSNT